MSEDARWAYREFLREERSGVTKAILEEYEALLEQTGGSLTGETQAFWDGLAARVEKEFPLAGE